MAHKCTIRGRGKERTEKSPSAVVFSDHRSWAMKTAPDPPWDRERAEEDVVRTEMNDMLVLSPDG